MALAPCGARTWRPFILDACCHAPHATYPGGGPETALEGFPSHRPYSVLLPVGFALPLLSPVARWALTPPFHPCPGKCRGGLLSVALSLGSPPPAVSRHRVSMEPGLSSPAAFRRLRVRPPGRLASAYKGIPGRKRKRKSRSRSPKTAWSFRDGDMHGANGLRRESPAPPSEPSPCCNRRPKPGSSASLHGRHCI